MKLNIETAKAATTFGWSLLRSSIEQIVAFIVFLILGRLLSPSDFGLITMAAAFIEILRLISWAGLNETIIRATHLDETQTNTAFWTALAIGLCLSGLIFFSAPLIAGLYHQKNLKLVIQGMSIIIVISAAGITHIGLITRNFGHKSLAYRAFIANLIAGIIAITIALNHGGIWALVVQRLISEIIQTAMVWLAYSWRPQWIYSFVQLQKMLSFSVKMTYSNIVNGINLRIIEGVVALLLPIYMVGSLRIANRLCELLNQLIFFPAYQVSLAIFPRLLQKGDSLQQPYLNGIFLLCLISCPCYASLALLAPRLIPFMFGEKWAMVAPIVQMLCLAAVPMAIQTLMMPSLVAHGHGNRLAFFSTLTLAVGIVFCILFAHYGIIVVAFSLSLRSWVLLPLALTLLKGRSDIQITALLKLSLLPLIISIGTALLTYFILNKIGAHLPVFLLLSAQLACFILLYSGVIYLLLRQHLNKLWANLIEMKGTNPKTEST